MTTKEAIVRVYDRLSAVRAERRVLRNEIEVLEAVLAALCVDNRYERNLATILDVLQEDES